MFSGIQSILSENKFNGITDEITLDGKNLIITGGNGCGKTRFAEKLFEVLFDYIVVRRTSPVSETQQTISQLMNILEVSEKDTPTWKNHIQTLSFYEAELDKLKKFQVFLRSNEQDEFSSSYHAGKGILLHFPAFRASNISRVNSNRAIGVIKEQAKVVATNINQRNSNMPKSGYFEEYLVALKHSRALYISEYEDYTKAHKIQEWFDKLEGDMCFLFEDDSLKLKYDIEAGSFSIVQKGKEPYGFQNLSSGFSAIMSIYAELIMNLEVSELSPNELSGIVIIDEIDAHLHISIQKKIMSFLCNAFPEIQFIVTTHSPFVVMSVDDAIIYDLSKHQQVEDLSLFSYEAVAEGLFGTSPISQVLMEKMTELISLSQDVHINKEKLIKLIGIIKQHESKLDMESLFYLKKAETELKKSQQGGSNV